MILNKYTPVLLLTHVRVNLARIFKTTPHFKHKYEAYKVLGNLSEPSKLPCYSYSLPAQACIMGQKLRHVKGTVCSICYALKGAYSFGNVRPVLKKRLILINHPHWVDAMTFVLNERPTMPYFRWHDSGDIQSLKHLKDIAEICRRTPNTLHWLPTREYQMIRDFAKENVIPDNLIIRLSATKIDGPAPEALAKQLGVCVSGVGKTEFTCPASKQGSACKDCRACWDKNVFNVVYHKH